MKIMFGEYFISLKEFNCAKSENQEKYNVRDPNKLYYAGGGIRTRDLSVSQNESNSMSL